MSEIEQTGLGAINYETAFRRQVKPAAQDFDVLGHVNNIVYLRWVQETATAHWRHVTPQSLQDKFIFVVLRHEIDYRDPVLPGEEVDISTWLGEARGPRFQRHVEIRKKEAAKFSAKALTTWCMVDQATGRPHRITDDVFAAFGVAPSLLKRR